MLQYYAKPQFEPQQREEEEMEAHMDDSEEDEKPYVLMASKMFVSTCTYILEFLLSSLSSAHCTYQIA